MPHENTSTSDYLKARHERLDAACDRDKTCKALRARIAELEAKRNRPQVGWETFFRKGSKTFTDRVRKRVDYTVRTFSKDIGIQLGHLLAKLEKNLTHNLKVIEENCRRDMAIAETRAKLRLRKKVLARILLEKDVEQAIERGNLNEAQRRQQRLRRKARLIVERVELRDRPVITGAVQTRPPAEEAPIDL